MKQELTPEESPIKTTAIAGLNISSLLIAGAVAYWLFASKR